jgi:hypothetical protein
MIDDRSPDDPQTIEVVASPDLALAQHLLDTLRASMRRQRSLCERALAQLQPADWHVRLDVESNSVAIIVRHVSGNLRSRWSDFLTSDGDKPDRDRDGEFAVTDATPERLMAEWDESWEIASATLEALVPADLDRTVTIRGVPHSVAQAIVRNLEHTGQHTGQIVLLAKHLRGDAWQALSVPTPRRQA